jgi:phosphoribosylaminoimidazole-succinocarboxamide synthase
MQNVAPDAMLKKILIMMMTARTIPPIIQAITVTVVIETIVTADEIATVDEIATAIATAIEALVKSANLSLVKMMFSFLSVD